LATSFVIAIKALIKHHTTEVCKPIISLPGLYWL